MFRFANPHISLAAAAVPALVALYWLAGRNRRRWLARFGRPGILEELMPEVSTGRTAFRFILFCAAVALVILAAARPQFGSKLREEKAQGIEMMLTVDVSNSMLAEDFEPNRLERTKYAIGKLFEGLQQDRVGLVVFAGEPKVQLPITSDYRMARAFARRIDPSLVSVQGTAIGKALEQALLAFSGDTEQSHGRVIILITDGENHDDDAIAVAERAAQMGVKIFTIGIGTPEGAPIQIGGEFIKDERAKWSSQSSTRRCWPESPTSRAAPTSARRSSRSVSTRSSRRSTRWSRPNFRRSASRSSTSSTNTCSSRRWSCCCWNSSYSTAATRCWRT